MAPATNPARPGAVIVAHGQPSNPAPAEAALRVLADDVARRLPGWDVTSATMAAPDILEQRLEQHSNAAVYPVFMADGWFTGMALPKRLRVSGKQHLMQPLGMDPRLPAIAADVTAKAVMARGWNMAETCLIIAAHGGQVSRNPAKAARVFTAALAAITGFADIRLGFIEESPDLSEVAAGAGNKALCLPFFAANGRHVRGDIPAALSKAGFEGGVLEPIGLAEQIPDLIAQSLTQKHMSKALA
jgi:sirohydrochlorin ferrochelatase